MSTPPASASSSPSAPRSAMMRWAVLALVSLAQVGGYYAYDSVGPVADHLQRLLHFTNTQLGVLNAIYSFPNLVVVLLGGIVVDRIGTRRSFLLFSALCLTGAVVTACSSSFTVMAIGRLIFGIGCESLTVACSVVLGLWFGARQLGLAFGISLSIGRVGSYAADMSPRWARSLYETGWQAPLWLAAAIVALSCAASVGYFLLERQSEKRHPLAAVPRAERFVLRDLWKYDRSYWYVVGLCLTFYAVILPFRSTFSIKYFQHARGLSLADAGTMNAYVFLAAIFVTPVFGSFVDKVGHRALMMGVGTLLLFAVFPLLAYTEVDLRLVAVLLGVSFSLVPAVLWPAVAHLVDRNRLGTAYGLMTMMQNIGLMTFNLVAGGLNDTAHASAENPGGYLPMLWMFGALSLVGLAFAEALRRRENGPHGHGLERARPAT